MSSKFAGVALLMGLLGLSVDVAAQAPQPVQATAPTDAERAERAEKAQALRAAATARPLPTRPDPATLTPEDRERLLKERRERAEALRGPAGERIRAAGAREAARLQRPGALRRPAAGLPLTRDRMELRIRGLQNGHNRRLAELQRIRQLAVEAGDNDAVARVDALLAKENAAFETLQTSMKQRLELLPEGAARPTLRPGATRGVGQRPAPPRPAPPRPAPPRPAPPRPAPPRPAPEGGTP